MASFTGPTDALKAGVASLRETGAYSDFTITCDSQSFAVHKAILGTQSDYFKTLFKTKSFKEGETGILKLKTVDLETCDPSDACDDPKIVALMIDYFYLLDYLPEKEEIPPSDKPPSPTPQQSTPSGQPQVCALSPWGANGAAVQAQAQSSFGSGSMGGFGASNPGAFGPFGPSRLPQPASQPTTNFHLVSHDLLFAAAVKYQIPALKTLALSKFKAAVDEGDWDHTSIARVIPLAYLSTDSTELRDVVANVLVSRPSLVHKPEIEKAVESVEGLAWQLFKMKC